MVRRWRFLGPAFSASRAQHVSDLQPKFALKPHHVWKYGRYPIEAKKERRKKEETTGQTYNGLLYSIERP